MNENPVILSRIVYIHSTTNPPLPDRSVDAEIKIRNSNQFILTNWARAQHQTQYTLKIIDPKSICNIKQGQTEMEKFYENVLLTFNLLMRSGAMIIQRTDMSKIEIIRKKLLPRKSMITETESGARIELNETLEITDSCHITMGFIETLDEDKIIDILRKIANLESNSSCTIKIQDLKKSLDEYKNAMGNFNRLGIFKSLFSALELATNCDNHDRKGIELDAEIFSSTSHPLNDIKEWRELNSRTKHIDKDTNHEAKYIHGMEKLPSYLEPLRETTRKTILKRLQCV